MDTITLVTNNEDIKRKLQENLALLRKTDKLISVNYDNAREVINEFEPSVIIINENINRKLTTDLIEFVKNNKAMSSSCVILLMNSFDGDFLLQAYDTGADDYFCAASEPAEILVRIINGIKKQQANAKLNRYSNNLEFCGVIEQKSKYYSAKAAEDMINLELNANNYNGGSFLVISLGENGKKSYDHDKMLDVINKSLRLNDIVIGYSPSKFGILLSSGVQDAAIIVDRIKNGTPDNWDIKAGIVSVSGINYSELEKRAACALNKAILENTDYNIFSDGNLSKEDWLEPEESEDKVYRFYKKAFSKKVENIISPVLYRIQRAYEDKIGDAKIEQFTDEKQSILRIINGQKESRMAMIYPGYSKLAISISHSGLDTPENREFTIPLKEITSSKISEIAEGFVNEYIGIYRHSN